MAGNRKRKTGFEDMVKNIQNENKKGGEKEIKPIAFDPNEKPKKKKEFVADEKKEKKKRKEVSKEEPLEETHLILKDDPNNKGKYIAEYKGLEEGQKQDEINDNVDEEELDFDDIDFEEIARKAFSEDITEQMKNVMSGVNELTEEEISRLEELKSKMESATSSDDEGQDENKDESKNKEDDPNIVEVDFILVDNDVKKEKPQTDEPKAESNYPKFDRYSKFNKDFIDTGRRTTKTDEPKAESNYPKFDRYSKFNRDFIDTGRKEAKTDEPKVESNYRTFDKNSKFNKEYIGDISTSMNKEKKEPNSNNHTPKQSSTTKKKETKQSTTTNKDTKETSTKKKKVNPRNNVVVNDILNGVDAAKGKAKEGMKEVKYASVRAKSEIDFAASEIGRITSNIFRNIKTTPWW